MTFTDLCCVVVQAGADAASGVSASSVSLARRSGGPSMLDSSNLFGASRHASQPDLSWAHGNSSYFSDVNPKNMKRLIHIIAVTSTYAKRRCRYIFTHL